MGFRGKPEPEGVTHIATFSNTPASLSPLQGLDFWFASKPGVSTPWLFHSTLLGIRTGNRKRMESNEFCPLCPRLPSWDVPCTVDDALLMMHCYGPGCRNHRMRHLSLRPQVSIILAGLFEMRFSHASHTPQMYGRKIRLCKSWRVERQDKKNHRSKAVKSNDIRHFQFIFPRYTVTVVAGS